MDVMMRGWLWWDRCLVFGSWAEQEKSRCRKCECGCGWRVGYILQRVQRVA